MDIAQERREALESLRMSLDLTQAEMAASLGLSLKTLNDLENDRGTTRKIHVLAAERVALRIASERGSVGLVPGSIIDDLIRLASDVSSALVLAELILLRAYRQVDKNNEPVREAVTEAMFQTIRAAKIARGEPAESGA